MESVKQAVMGHGNDKNRQLADNMVEPTKDSRITTDYGVKQSNTDDWLKVVREDKTGPMLLEDPHGREKVESHSKLDVFIYITNTSLDPPLRS